MLPLTSPKGRIYCLIYVMCERTVRLCRSDRGNEGQRVFLLGDILIYVPTIDCLGLRDAHHIPQATDWALGFLTIYDR